uniref:Uncharacterized protein n=1 Tax=Oryza brachyantha TaxID=4533 RepID=J3MR48_ORYBR
MALKSELMWKINKDDSQEYLNMPNKGSKLTAIDEFGSHVIIVKFHRRDTRAFETKRKPWLSNRQKRSSYPVLTME